MHSKWEIKKELSMRGRRTSSKRNNEDELLLIPTVSLQRGWVTWNLFVGVGG